MLATVTTHLDVVDPFDGETSLREAVEATLSGGTIDFASSLNGTTIALNQLLGQIDIEETLTIDASMLPNGLTIDGNDPNSQLGNGIRLFNIVDVTSGADPPEVTFIGPAIGLTLKGGDPVWNEANQNGQGGAIRSQGPLTLLNVHLIENDALDGGAIFLRVDGGGSAERTVLDIQHSVIDHNSARRNGGAVFVHFSQEDGAQDRVYIQNSSSLSHNEASTGNGGALHIYGIPTTNSHAVTISASTLNTNTAVQGGAVFHRTGTSSRVDLSILNGSIISGDNRATNFGGGIYSKAYAGSQIRVEDSTISGNSTSSIGGGGGLFVSLRDSSLVIEDSEVSANTTGYGSGGGVYAILRENATLTITDSTITENTAMDGDGGGIRANMPSAGHQDALGIVFTMQRSRVESNHATKRGGGLFTATGSGGEVRIEDSVISGNDAGLTLSSDSIFPGRIPYSGGGMYAYLFSDENPATLTIAGTEISGNTAGQHGGGLAVCTKRQDDTSAISRLSVYNTTISGNKAGHTTAENEPGKGGGAFLAIYNGPFDPEEALDARFQNVTITKNTADEGGGIYSYLPNLGPPRSNDVRLTNSIASANRKHADSPINPQPSNLHGSFNITDTVFNMIGQSGTGNATYNHITHQQEALLSDPASGNIFTDDPKLGDLAWNGGPTRTHRPMSDSDAIDAGSNDLAIVPFPDDPLNPIALTTDQRGTGFTRFFDVAGVDNGIAGYVDIGAYEIGLAKVIDVLLDGVIPGTTTEWTRDPYSFADLVPLGKQLAPIYTGGVNKIVIRFSEDVDVTEEALTLYGSNGQETTAPLPKNVTGFSDYDPETSSATWTFDPLAGDKYRIDLDANQVTGPGGELLDGHWDNETGSSLDDWQDDPVGRTFLSTDNSGTGGMDFQFLFALQPGDYNQDGFVDLADYLTFQIPERPVDGDGNGVPDQLGDYSIWLAQYGQRLAYHRAIRGDYFDDDVINGADYLAWRQQLGMSVANWTGADGNGSGVVDVADYYVWIDWFNTRSAWNLSSTGQEASLLQMVDFENAPTVMNVTISGSNSTHDPYSFDDHDGSGEQLRTVPVGGADTISITFSEDVNVVASNLRLVGLRTADVPVLAEFTYDIFTMTATWRFETSSIGDGYWVGDHYLISLSDAVADMEGNQLDGEWVNPATLTTTNGLVSEFPSGNGTAGGNFNFVMTLLAGDANLDLSVGTGDFDILLWNYGQYGQIFTDADFNGDGQVSAADFDYMLNMYGANLQSVWALADLNDDFVINDSDANILANNLGMSNPTWADGDLDGDGDIDAADADLLFTQYGLEWGAVS